MTAFRDDEQAQRAQLEVLRRELVTNEAELEHLDQALRAAGWLPRRLAWRRLVRAALGVTLVAVVVVAVARGPLQRARARRAEEARQLSGQLEHTRQELANQRLSGAALERLRQRLRQRKGTAAGAYFWEHVMWLDEQKPGEAWLIVGAASCWLELPGPLARAKQQLDPTGRERLREACQALGGPP